jgi:UDP-N-acetylglucosamine transferase subunit ALG13
MILLKKIAYYISDYGFGHATRSIAVIRELLDKKNGIHITICTSFSLPYIKESLAKEDQNRLDFRDVQNDIGFILKDNSVEPDIEIFQEVYNSYIDRSQHYINQEVKFLDQEAIDLVIGDIPPFPFLASSRLNIPSIGISNFTWYTAYMDLLKEQELSPLHEPYNNMEYFIQLGAGNEPHWGRIGHLSAGFYSRKVDKEKVRTIIETVNPAGDKNIVYFGLRMKIDVKTLSDFKVWDSGNCVFIVASNVEVKRDNVFKIPIADTESHNYIAASDIVISKPGWGTVAEAIQSNKPLLIIDRSNMREDQNTIKYLKENNRCELIKWEDFAEYRISSEEISKLKGQELNGIEHINSLDIVIKKILSILVRNK